MRLSLIIAAHNEGPALWKTVASCVETCAGLDYEIVVADEPVRAPAPIVLPPAAPAPTIAPTAPPAPGLPGWAYSASLILGAAAYLVRRKLPESHFLASKLGLYTLSGIALILAAILSALALYLQSTALLSWTAAGLVALNAGAAALMTFVAGDTPNATARTFGPAALLLLALSASGCAAFYRAIDAQPVALKKAEKDVLKCGAEGVQAVMKTSAPVVLDALAGNEIGRAHV